MRVKVLLRSDSSFDKSIDALKAGLYSDERDGNDRQFINQAKELGQIAYTKCTEDPYWSPATAPANSSPTTEANEFLTTCRKVIELKDIQLVDIYADRPEFRTITIETNFSTQELEDAYSRCMGQDRPLLYCGMTCITGNTEPACDQIRNHHGTGEKYNAALACAENPIPENAACVRICNIEQISCLEGMTPTAGTTPPREVDPTGEGGDVTGAGVTPPDSNNTPPGGDQTGVTPPGTNSDPNSPTDVIENLANNVARDVLGSGMGSNMQRGNPSGSLDVPDVSIEGFQADSGNFNSINSPGTVSAFQPTINPALINMPSGSARGRPGGETPSAGAPQGGMAGRPPGGGAMGGGAGMSGSGSSGTGGKRRGGGVPVNQRLKTIADGLGGNQFLSADGAKGNSRQQTPEIQKVNRRLQKKIQENADQNNRALLQSAFQNNLNGQTRKELFMKASYFPNNTEVYLDMRESSDYLNESGQ